VSAVARVDRTRSDLKASQDGKAIGSLAELSILAFRVVARERRADDALHVGRFSTALDRLDAVPNPGGKAARRRTPSRRVSRGDRALHEPTVDANCNVNEGGVHRDADRELFVFKPSEMQHENALFAEQSAARRRAEDEESERIRHP